MAATPFQLAAMAGLKPVTQWASQRWGTPVLDNIEASEVGQSILLGAMMLPVMVIGAMVGLRVGAKLSRHMLRRLAFSLLLVLALASIISPML